MAVYDYLEEHQGFELPGVANVALVVASIADDTFSKAQLVRWKKMCEGQFDEPQPAVRVVVDHLVDPTPIFIKHFNQLTCDII